MTFDVLISHSTADKAVSNLICNRLELAGIRCWIAPRNIAAGTEWTAAILDGINSSRMMVLVFSESANSSRHVQREILYATENKMPILPVRIQPLNPSGGLAYCLLGVQWLDAMPPPFDQHIAALISRVRGLLAESKANGGASAGAIGMDSEVPPPAPVPKARDVFFECSECGRSMVIDAAAAGTSVECIFCDKLVIVPGTPLKREPAIDPAVLAQLTEELSHALGPIARHLVRTAAASFPTLYDLCHDLAKHISDQKERAHFLQATERFVRGIGDKAPNLDASAHHELPSGTERHPISWPPDFLKQIKSELAHYIGPFAGVLVERAAKEASNSRELYKKLAAHLHSPKEREQWLRTVESLQQ